MHMGVIAGAPMFEHLETARGSIKPDANYDAKTADLRQREHSWNLDGNHSTYEAPANSSKGALDGYRIPQPKLTPEVATPKPLFPSV